MLMFGIKLDTEKVEKKIRALLKFSLALNGLSLVDRKEIIKFKDAEKAAKAAKAQLEEEKKLSYLGTMSSALAHQINQPVGSIRASVSSAQLRLKDGLLDPEKTMLVFDDLWQQSERLKNIINTFQDFAKGDRGEMMSVDLNHVVRQAVLLFSAQLQQREIGLHVILADFPLQILINPFDLQEILLILINNAKDVLENQQKAQIWLKTKQNNKHVILVVEDNGAGIADDIKRQLFMPFTTTKSTEKGTGLGLYIAHKIMQKAKGKISYHTRQGGGACFRLEFPFISQETPST